MSKWGDRARRRLIGIVDKKSARIKATGPPPPPPPVPSPEPPPPVPRRDIIPHPVSGIHYVNVISSDSMAFADYYAAHQLLENVPWISLVSSAQLEESHYPNDEKCTLIFWHKEQDLPNRRAKIAARYTELIGHNPPESHKAALGKFVGKIDRYDFVLAHTPEAVDFLSQYSEKVYLAPVGFCRKTFGTPKFNTPKKYEITFYGGMAGKRTRLLPVLKDKLKHKLHIIPGTYGLQRRSFLDQSKAVLQLPQVSKCAFPTMRIWQSIAASAVMLLEPTDAYPARPGVHYIEIPELTENTVEEVAAAIDAALRRSDLRKIAQKAYTDLSQMSILDCFEKYVIPASMPCPT